MLQVARKLSDSVTYVKSVGPAKAEHFAAMGINTVYDLLMHLPRRYENWGDITPIRRLEVGVVSTIKGYVRSISMPHGPRKIVKVKITDDEGSSLELTFFNGQYISIQLMKDASYLFRGELTEYQGKRQMVNPKKCNELELGSPLVPIYPSSSKLNSRAIRTAIKNALDSHGYLFAEEIVPAALREKHQLLSTYEALRAIHLPVDYSDIIKGRTTLAYDELVMYTYGLVYSRKRLEEDEDSGSRRSVPHIYADENSNKLIAKIKENVGFELTSDQKAALNQIAIDMHNPIKPMNRLVQGDVGCGKTIVANLAMAMVASRGYQAVLMAPTGVLAVQHYKEISRNCEGTGLNVVLLVGGMKKSEQKQIYEQIRDGSANIIIGTHSVIEESLEFNNLALFITDEQHRFGVIQRSAKLNEEHAVHNLLMTATPIPRTLCMALFGEVDETLIKTKPSGRKEILTRSATYSQMDKIFASIKMLVDRGEQVYIVCPLISESDDDQQTELDNSLQISLFEEERDSDTPQAKSKLKSVEEMMNDISRSSYMAGISAERLTGKMTQQAKEDVMRRFAMGEVDVLVATTVVEVGVNNPNATAIIIMDADRFGLSTLHQLRGRVGRGDKQSHCILVSDSKGKTARERIKVMCETNDGFVIAERDMQLRGPGDIFGTRQHGLPEFKVVNVYEDLDKADEVRDELENMSDEEKPKLEEAISQRFSLHYKGAISFGA